MKGPVRWHKGFAIAADDCLSFGVIEYDFETHRDVWPKGIQVNLGDGRGIIRCDVFRTQNRGFSDCR